MPVNELTLQLVNRDMVVLAEGLQMAGAFVVLMLLFVVILSTRKR